MIIEIRDIPGQIKKLTFEVEFENGKISKTLTTDPIVIERHVPRVDTEEDENASEHQEIVPMINNREQKEIPPEMKDIQF